jgi:NAD(P)-dependent dehydrogenase (short-subunit alcohol dehydrogenase family)
MPLLPQTVLITGASGDLGRAIAVALSDSAKLILSGRSLSRLEETRSLCTHPGQHLVWPCDLAAPQSLETTLKRFLEKNAVPVEAMVYAAGIFTAGPIRLATVATGLELLTVNFLSAAELSRLLLKSSLNQAHLKTIVYISTVSARRGVRGFHYYSASKGALDAFMRSLAQELAPRVRVNSVLPGAVATASSDPAMLETAKAAHPLGLGRPADVAGAVKYLLSDDARWITGQQLAVDGGWLCG